MLGHRLLAAGGLQPVLGVLGGRGVGVGVQTGFSREGRNASVGFGQGGVKSLAL